MLIRVRVKAGARNERVGKSGDIFDLSVREKALGGAANARVLELLALSLGVSVKKLRIVKGQRSPAKTVKVL